MKTCKPAMLGQQKQRVRRTPKDLAEETANRDGGITKEDAKGITKEDAKGITKEDVKGITKEDAKGITKTKSQKRTSENKSNGMSNSSCKRVRKRRDIDPAMCCLSWY
eukprot:CAMPEP_0173469480 /NCGR_PEP_ID=MMETSP1357-20121228/77385_1 /TAXON_ID=77926 /ORGANISM="Hemiselmis rufescens, Strain PCC563" /LENGTH=107 /DNA_ID=CAMNT_0014437725 /DNA_START=434 /DNA_END=757 /DNA_ORIENTATION=-